MLWSDFELGSEAQRAGRVGCWGLWGMVARVSGPAIASKLEGRGLVKGKAGRVQDRGRADPVMARVLEKVKGKARTGRLPRVSSLLLVRVPVIAAAAKVPSKETTSPVVSETELPVASETVLPSCPWEDSRAPV